MPAPARAHLERELKLEAPRGFVMPDLTGVQPGATVAPLPAVRMVTSYWDTEDLRLTRGGVSLRHRVVEDGEPHWTVKLSTGASTGLFERDEVDFGGPPDEVPPAAASLVQAHTRRGSLSRVAVLESRRVRVDLRDADGRSLAEIDDDDVIVVEGPRPLTGFRELEVELASDAPRAVAPAVAERFHAAGARAGSKVSKVARALGDDALELPDFAGPPVGKGSSAGSWFSAVVAEGLSRLVRHDPGVRLAGDPEDLHQARVAIRRLRSDLRLLVPIAERQWVDGLRSELSWVAEPLGRARDADILMQRLWGQVELLSPDDEDIAKHLLEVLAATRTKLQGELSALLEDPRYLGVLEVLTRAVHDPVLTDLASARAVDVAPVLVKSTWKKLDTAVRRAGHPRSSSPSVEALHRVRIAAKRCRYACEAASLVVGKPAKRMARAVSGIQTVLGDLQDAVVAESWLRQVATGQLNARQAVVVGELIALQRALARQHREEWDTVWRAASRKKLRRWLN